MISYFGWVWLRGMDCVGVEIRRLYFRTILLELKVLKFFLNLGLAKRLFIWTCANGPAKPAGVRVINHSKVINRTRYRV